MDLSKAYHCIPHDFLIAKLEAYGLDKTSLDLLIDYLSNPKQSKKIGCSFTRWWDIIFEFMRYYKDKFSVLFYLIFS